MYHSILVEEGFKKATIEAGKTTPNALSNHLHDKSFANKCTISVRTFNHHYDIYIKKKSQTDELSPNALKFYLSYLGYPDFETFSRKLVKTEPETVIQNQNEEIQKNTITSKSFATIKIILLALALFMGIIIIILTYNKSVKTLPKIENFNVDKQYFYIIQKDGKYQILDEPNPEIQALPIQPKVLDAYYFQEGVDTTRKEFREIKTQYFQKQSQVQNIEEKISSPEKKITYTLKNDNKVYFNIMHKESIDQELLAVFKDRLANQDLFFSIEKATDARWKINGKSEYKYKPSNLIQSAIVCTITFNYEIYDSTQKEVKKTKSLSINGTGYDESEAKSNALKKVINLIEF